MRSASSFHGIVGTLARFAGRCLYYGVDFGLYMVNCENVNTPGVTSESPFKIVHCTQFFTAKYKFSPSHSRMAPCIYKTRRRNRKRDIFQASYRIDDRYKLDYCGLGVIAVNRVTSSGRQAAVITN